MSVIVLFQLLGLTVACALAYWSFRRRSLSLGEEPTLPEYFTRRSMYWLGIATYCTLIALIFLAMVNLWMPIAPLLEASRGYLAQGDIEGLFARLDGALLLPWIAAAAFVA
ncbi:MAG: hypothetical protein HKO07_02900, partial [Pseudomonadales bacterium]|nr:hypothetical protein [Pseudomonadales bacterium]